MAETEKEKKTLNLVMMRREEKNFLHFFPLFLRLPQLNTVWRIPNIFCLQDCTSVEQTSGGRPPNTLSGI